MTDPAENDDTPQTADTVVMIEPAAFAANAETAATNRFQSDAPARDARAAARAESAALAAALDAAGVRVLRFAGNTARALPDEVFPNNWFSTHADGTLALYPMAAPSRRAERRADVCEALTAEHGFAIHRRLDFSAAENAGEFLEGTGSLVLDRPNRIAYACRSARTHPALAATVAAALGYELELFDAVDRNGQPIYHTNVALAIGTRAAIVASCTIAKPAERRRIVERLEASGRTVVDIDFTQLHAFAGNALELAGRDGPVLAMSRRARTALRPDQLAVLERDAALVAIAVDTIERVGGGSVRCMLAEIFLPRSASASCCRVHWDVTISGTRRKANGPHFALHDPGAFSRPVQQSEYLEFSPDMSRG